MSEERAVLSERSVAMLCLTAIAVTGFATQHLTLAGWALAGVILVIVGAL